MEFWIIKQMIKDTYVMIISSVIHLQIYIPWSITRYSQKLFLLCASIQNAIDDKNITKANRHDEKPRA